MASGRGEGSLAPRRGATTATLRSSTNPPTGGQGVGDGNWASWYQLALRESESRISEPPGPPFPIASAQVR